MTSPTRSAATLGPAMARALEGVEKLRDGQGLTWYGRDLALHDLFELLRADPAVLEAIAEALHETDRLEHPGARGSIAVEWKYLNEQERAHEFYRAARLADALLGRADQ